MDIRGILDQTDIVRVGANFTLLTVVDVLETEEAIQVMGLLYLTWVDERLIWKPADYNGTDQILVHQDRVWKPEVRLANPLTTVKVLGDGNSKIRIYNTGRVFWMTADMFTTKCEIDVVSFPWDRQLCALRFKEAAYTTHEVILVNDNDDINTKYYGENESWKLLKTAVESRLGFQSDVRFWICIERRPSFHLFVVFLPITMLSILNLCACCVRVDSGERISFAITILLSVTLYLSLVANNLPTHSKGMAAMIYFLVLVLFESTVICMMSICSQHVYYKSGTPPFRCQLIVMKLLRRGDKKTTFMEGERKVRTQREWDSTETKVSQDDTVVEGCSAYITWEDVSLFIDRVVCFLGSLAVLSAFTVFVVCLSLSKVNCK